MSGRTTRRRFLGSAFAAGALCACRSTPARRRHVEITRHVLWNGRAGAPTWFHPRPCVVPGADGPLVVMTLQSISGSDYYGPVHWTRSADLGATWTAPQPIQALGRRAAGGGYQEGVCDVVPMHDPASGRILAIGHNVFYRGGRLARPQRDRHPVYVVGDADGNWSTARRLAWEHEGAERIYTCGCAERLQSADGTVLLPISFGGRDREDRAVTTLRCRFDGARLVAGERGAVLRLAVGRGLLEPSLCAHGGRVHMTIRAEDGHGYHSTSADGMAWSPIEPWRFDDGEALAMSTTQQHWIANDHGLFLVYTRKDATNGKVMRYRAPLYVAEVDPGTMALRRATERVVLPLVGDPATAPQHVARMGNFHTLQVTADEAWVTVGEARPTQKWQGDVLLARLRWV